MKLSSPMQLASLAACITAFLTPIAAQAAPYASTSYRLQSAVTASGSATDATSASYRLEGLAGEGYSTAWVSSTSYRMSPGFLLRDDLPTVTLSLSASSGSETAATAITVTATASRVVGADQTVQVQVSGTGITAGDYSLSGSAITIAAGKDRGSVTFTIHDDALAEGSETATLTLANPSAGLTLGATISDQVAIADNDYLLTVASGGHGTVGGGGVKTAGATVNLTATPDAGYAFASWSPAPCAASFTMPDNDLTCTASFALKTYDIATSVNPVGAGSLSCTPNPVSHGGEANCTASANNGYTFKAFSGDCSGATCSLSNVTSAKSVIANFLINQAITFGTAPNVTVGGIGTVSATGGASGNAVTFTSQTTDVCTTDGTNGSTVTGVSEGSCIIVANQAGNGNYAAAPEATQQFTVAPSNDITYTLSGGGVVTEGDGVAQSVVLTLSRSGSHGASSVDFALTGTATPTADFTGPVVGGTGVTLNGSTLTFDAGATSATLTFGVVGDLHDEDDQTVIITLSNPTDIGDGSGALSGSPQTITIADNDPLPQLVVQAVPGEYVEANTGSFNSAFVATLVGATEKAVTVNYATANGSASAGSDYTAKSGTLQFGAVWDSQYQSYFAISSQIVLVPFNGDTANEGNETFSLNLTTPENATIGTASATITLVDDDDGTGNTCVADSRFHTTSYTGNYYCNATTRIQAGTNVAVQDGAQVVYSAPVVRLLPSTVVSGAYFHAGQNLPNPFPAARSRAEVNDANTARQARTPRTLGADDLPEGLRGLLAAAGVASWEVEPAVGDEQGDWVVFATPVGLVDADTNGLSDIYGYRVENDQLRLISRTADGLASSGPSTWPVIDGSGERILFQSSAYELTGDLNGASDILLYRTAEGTLENLTLDSHLPAAHPSINGEGSWVLYDQGDTGDETIQGLEPDQRMQESVVPGSRRPALSPDGRYSVWLEGEGSILYRDYERDLELRLPTPPQLAPFLDEARPLFSTDGTQVEWHIPERQMRVITENPLSGW